MVGVGIIGYGYWGPNIVRNFAETRGAAVRRVPDQDAGGRVRREQFRAGAAVATDFIDAESELRRARLELINAAIDVRIARARLNRAVGRGADG